MNRAMAALIAAAMMAGFIEPAVCTRVQAAESFPEVSFEAQRRQSHVWAYASMIVGAGLIVGSFGLHDRANETYDEYLAASDPEEIDRLFNEATKYDRLSSAALIGGEVLVAAGLYLRFLRHPTPSRFSFSAGIEQCRVVYRF